MENGYSSGLRRRALSPSPPEGGRYSAIRLVFLKCTDGGLCFFFFSDQDIIIFRVATIVTLLVPPSRSGSSSRMAASYVCLATCTLLFPLTAYTQQLTPRDIK